MRNISFIRNKTPETTTHTGKFSLRHTFKRSFNFYFTFIEAYNVLLLGIKMCVLFTFSPNKYIYISHIVGILYIFQRYLKQQKKYYI